MKSFGSPKEIIMDKTKFWRSMQFLELVQADSVQSNLLNNQYQNKFEFLYGFAPNKSCACLLNVEPKNIVFKKHGRLLLII